MGYADVTHVKSKLLIDGADTVSDGELALLDTALSLAFDAATGRTFAVTPIAETIDVTAPGVSSLLVLPEPIRTVTAIESGGTWDGTVWINGTIHSPATYRLTFGDAGKGFWAIEGADIWAGSVRVTGSWADVTVGATVPDDVTYAVTYAVLRQWRRERAGTDGQMGPDGLVVPVGEATDTPIWRNTVARYRVAQAVAV